MTDRSARRRQIDKRHVQAENRVTMESADSVAAKRRALLDALMMCLSRSRVVNIVDAKTVRGVLDSAADDLWREGEFRLEAVWKLLMAQPGLTAEEVAPPLLVFKAFEKELGVAVRVPQALSAIPRGEQVKLRDALGIQRSDFQRALEPLRNIAAAEQPTSAKRQPARQAAALVASDVQKVKAGTQRRTPVAIALALVTLAGIGLGVRYAVHDSSTAMDVSDVAGTLQLTHARAAQGSMSATITDPRWEPLSKEEQQKLALQLMEAEAPKGIHTIMLSDEKGTTRALISDGAGGRTAIIP
jgi:hypothetical protein